VKKILNILAGAAISGVATTAALVGAGAASAAPDVSGETYADATTAIDDDGGKPVVATRVGDTMDQDDCIVTTVSDASFLRIDSNDEGEVLLSLNCAGAYATAKNSGASVASPAGRKAKSDAEEKAAEEEKESLEGSSEPDV
jgi:hypothetical protein